MQGFAQGHKQSHIIGQLVTIKLYALWYGDYRPALTLTPTPTLGPSTHAGIDLLQGLRKLPNEIQEQIPVLQSEREVAE